MSILFTPTEDELIVRHRHRIGKLRTAIAKEKEKDKPDKDRIESLSSELERRKSELKTILEA